MPSYDVVIVGAGSAGCVLANRLSADPATKVLLLEAGGKDRSPNIKIPAAFPNQFHTKLDWDYATEPEPALDGRSMYVPRGKSLGGSSSMNAMLYVRGCPLDYDGWAAEGATGWSWQDVLPYFKRSEHNARGESEFHGGSGELFVSEQRSPRPHGRRILQACVAAGIPQIADYNGPEQDGVSPFQVLQKGGRRWSSADAFLRPVLRRPNLEVRTGVTVQRLELSGTRVTGVTFADARARVQTVSAGRVVLSAGSFGSPQILMLSGIGAPDELAEAGVSCRHALPDVGHHLQDHPFYTLNFAVSEGRSLFGADKPKPMAEWALRRSGPLTSTVAEVNAFVRSRPGLPAADLQFHMGAAYFDDNGAATYDGDAIVLGPVLVAPRSRGRVWLRSSDPSAKVRILTNSLTEPEDMEALVSGIQIARTIAEQGPLAEIITSELTPGPDAVDRDALEADVRKRLMLLYHPVGTCAIGKVVDSQLNVVGLEGLTVADASVMPTVTRGNTHAPTVMIAEKAADLIRGRATAAPVAA